MFDKILIPVDMAHTEKTSAMIPAAKQVAGEGGKMLLVNIVQAMPSMAEMALPQEYFDMAISDATEALEKIAKDEGLNAEIVVRIGQPASDILEVANDHNADLIIVGSHQPGFQDYLLGSTAARVVRHATCPVLVMR